MDKLLALALYFACVFGLGALALVFNINRRGGIAKVISYCYIWLSFIVMSAILVKMMIQLDKVVN